MARFNGIYGFAWAETPVTAELQKPVTAFGDDGHAQLAF